MEVRSHHISGVPSRAAIAGHPIHPALIPLPITFLLTAFVADILCGVTGDLFWPRVSYWALLAGLATGGLAAIAGAVDFFSIERARAHRAGWIHAGGNVTVMILAAINILIRRPGETVPMSGLILSAITAVLLGITGWMGGELVFRHMIGVTGHEEHRD